MEKIKKLDIKTKILLIIACVAVILGIVFCIIGFDKINNYYNSESFYSLNVNAYVGGDAYNYIINGTYFSGYLSFAGSLFICGCVCGIGGLLLEKKSSKTTEGQQETIETSNGQAETTESVAVEPKISNNDEVQ